MFDDGVVAVESALGEEILKVIQLLIRKYQVRFIGGGEVGEDTGQMEQGTLFNGVNEQLSLSGIAAKPAHTGVDF